jgi:hypothetical protein
MSYNKCKSYTTSKCKFSGCLTETGNTVSDRKIKSEII